MRPIKIAVVDSNINRLNKIIKKLYSYNYMSSGFQTCEDLAWKLHELNPQVILIENSELRRNTYLDTVLNKFDYTIPIISISKDSLEVDIIANKNVYDEITWPTERSELEEKINSVLSRINFQINSSISII